MWHGQPDEIVREFLSGGIRKKQGAFEQSDAD